jgi:hypothetical protein
MTVLKFEKKETGREIGQLCSSERLHFSISKKRKGHHIFSTCQQCSQDAGMKRHYILYVFLKKNRRLKSHKYQQVCFWNTVIPHLAQRTRPADPHSEHNFVQITRFLSVFRMFLRSKMDVSSWFLTDQRILHLYGKSRFTQRK